MPSDSANIEKIEPHDLRRFRRRRAIERHNAEKLFTTPEASAVSQNVLA
jgi:hypothetical protein